MTTPLTTDELHTSQLSHVVERVKAHEGFRPTPYLCPAGYVTIGYGCNLEAHPDEILERYPSVAWAIRDGTLRGDSLLKALRRSGLEWSKATADLVLWRQLAASNREVLRRLPWVQNLDPVRRGVLVEMAFQMGVGALLRFTRTLANVEAGEYGQAASQMLQSRWAKQTPARAKRLAEIMRTGEA